jgi:hypothetical protein
MKTWIFSTYFLKKAQISSLIKIGPVGPELFHADRRTDITKLIVAFRNFAHTPKNVMTLSLRYTMSGASRYNAQQLSAITESF